MKKILVFILALAVFSACNKTENTSIKTQTSENFSSNATVKENVNTEQPKFSFEKLISAQSSSNEIPRWIAPDYKGLQVGKATETDVVKMFGEPEWRGQPFDEEVSTDDKSLFTYENIGDFDGRTEFIFDRRSRILEEIWLSPNYQRPLTIEKAIEIYGNDYFVRGFKNICSSKKPAKLEYPFTIVYPQKGIFFWIREKNEVDYIYYTAKCPR